MSTNCDGSTRKSEENTSALTKEEISSSTLTRNDVLLGRGGKVFQHAGNQQLRDICNACIHKYNSVHKCQKLDIAKIIWKEIRALDPPGRFLKRNKPDSPDDWLEVSEEVGVEKVSQALRDVRHQDSLQEKKKIGKNSPSTVHVYSQNPQEMIGFTPPPRPIQEMAISTDSTQQEMIQFTPRAIEELSLNYPFHPSSLSSLPLSFKDLLHKRRQEISWTPTPLDPCYWPGGSSFDGHCAFSNPQTQQVSSHGARKAPRLIPLFNGAFYSCGTLANSHYHGHDRQHHQDQQLFAFSANVNNATIRSGVSCTMNYPSTTSASMDRSSKPNRYGGHMEHHQCSARRSLSMSTSTPTDQSFFNLGRSLRSTPFHNQAQVGGVISYNNDVNNFAESRANNAKKRNLNGIGRRVSSSSSESTITSSHPPVYFNGDSDDGYHHNHHERFSNFMKRQKL